MNNGDPDTGILLRLVWLMVPLSLISIGGGASILAGIEEGVVFQYGWFDQSEFLDLFAISRASPGPGSMLITLIGWRLAGWIGALVATFAIFLPSSILCYLVYRTTNLSRGRRWFRILRTGLAPIGTGLVIAGVISIMRVSGAGILGLAMAFCTFALLLLWSKLPVPVLLLAGAGVTLAIHGF